MMEKSEKRLKARRRLGRDVEEERVCLVFRLYSKSVPQQEATSVACITDGAFRWRDEEKAERQRWRRQNRAPRTFKPDKDRKPATCVSVVADSSFRKQPVGQ